MKDIILKAENLKFSYTDTEEYALKGLSVELERGKKVAVMGANGSGKSTFFLCMNGIHQPCSGQLFLDGEKMDYSRKGLRKLRSKVGMVFQDPDDQLFSASVKQEISFGPMNMGLSEEEVRKAVDDIIADLEIEDFKDSPTHSLSGGQKKQVSIADVMVMNPEIVVLDEPAASLDPKHTIIVHKIVDRMVAEGITVIISTHDVDFVMEWAEEVVVIHQGLVAAQGSPEEVFADLELLEKTNLKQPAALELFNSLVAKGILSKDLKTPRTLKELETYIEKL